MPGLRDSVATSLQHYLLTIRVFFLWLAQTLFGIQPGGKETPASTPAEQLPLSRADVLAKRRGSPSSPEFVYSPPSPDLAVDLEQGLLVPSTPKLLETPRSTSRQRNLTDEATPGGSHSPQRATADPSSHLTITSAVLAAYIRDGVGLSLSESAQEMLGLNLRSSTVDEAEQQHQRKSEWWDATDPLRAQDSFGEAPSTHATFDQESNSRSTPWTTPDLDRGHPQTLSPRITPLGPNSARASTWAVKSLVVTDNDEAPPPSAPSFFFHSYPLPAHRPRSPPLNKSSAIGVVADPPTISHHKNTTGSLSTPNVDENDNASDGAAEPWQNLLLLPAHFINDLHETFASDFDGMSLSLSTPSILRRRRATSVGSSSLQDSVDGDERGCHHSATGSGRDVEQERALSPSLSAPEPRYYAFYHEFYNRSSGGESVAASYGVTARKDASGSSGVTGGDYGYEAGGEDEGRLDYGETTKRREKTIEDLVMPTRQQHRPSGITQRRDIIRCSTTLRRPLPTTTGATTKTTRKARTTTTSAKPNVTSRSPAHSTHSACSSHSHYSRSSLSSSPYDSATSSESAAESDMFPSTWCVQPMTRSALRRSFLGSCVSTEEEEEDQEEQGICAFLRDKECEIGHEDEEGGEEERQVVDGSMLDGECGRVLVRDDFEHEGLGKPLASVQDGAGVARLSRMPTFIVPLAPREDTSPEKEIGGELGARTCQSKQAVQRAVESDLVLGGHGKSKEAIGYAQQLMVGLDSDADLEGSVATFVSCESFGSRMH